VRWKRDCNRSDRSTAWQKIVPADADDVPAEYREAMQQSHDAWDALYAVTLDEFGEPEIARLFRTDPEQFDQRYEDGRQFFHGPGNEEDDWLGELLDTVAACVAADSPMGPLGLRYREEEGFWEIWIYPTPVELVGGRHDGEVVVPGFSLDLEQLRGEFDSIAALGWNSLGLNLPEGPYIFAEGLFQGHEVYLQVLAYAPEGEEPGLKVDASRRRRPARITAQARERNETMSRFAMSMFLGWLWPSNRLAGRAGHPVRIKRPPRFRPRKKVKEIIGHRGSCGDRPENTLVSYRRAIEVGATVAECDVRSARGVDVFRNEKT